MNEYVEILKRYVAENPPNYGSDARSILEMLFSYYHACNNTDTNAVKAAFEDLYQRMHGMPLREMDRIVDAVCTLCREHEKAGFVERIRVGMQCQSIRNNRKSSDYYYRKKNKCDQGLAKSTKPKITIKEGSKRNALILLFIIRDHS